MSANWIFDDAPNTASFTTRFVLDGAPILRVYHDFEGGWQFHGLPDDPVTTEVARIVSLESMISRDATLASLHDLPYGWCAWRQTTKSPWTRAKNHPFPLYEENGFYVEDAVWMSQFRDDVDPPPENVRNSLPVGTYVKLLFRFAGEKAERKDNETERMWVLVTGVDDNGYYVGTLENDPHHADVLNCGDTIHFHSSHVAAILDQKNS